MALISFRDWLQKESSAWTRRRKEFEKFAKPGDVLGGSPHSRSTASPKLVEKIKSFQKKKKKKSKKKE